MKLSELLDQIDMLDGELLPDWKYNDRTGAVLANAYRKQGDKWNCFVAKDIPADRDGEFIALARAFAPAAAKALQAVLKERKEAQERFDSTPNDQDREGQSRLAEIIESAIADQMEGDQ